MFGKNIRKSDIMAKNNFKESKKNFSPKTRV